MLQALRMAAAKGGAKGAAGGGGARWGEVDVSEEDAAEPAQLLAAVAEKMNRHPPARHTLLHIACGGCEW